MARATMLAFVRTLCLVTLALLFGAGCSDARERAPIREVPVAQLPAEAHDTLALIKKGGPFPYRKDGAVFGNRERRLPQQQQGYYREYTVKTPGAKDRGARRIVAGRGSEYYYTDDHYETFRRIRE